MSKWPMPAGHGRAVQAALPHDYMLFAAFGDDNFFVVDAPMYPEGWAWPNDAGTAAFIPNDPAKAAEHLTAATMTVRPGAS